MLVPRTHVMSESDWRDFGIQQSGMGDPWTRTSHLTVLAAIIQEVKEMKLWATSQPQALHSCPYSLISFWQHDYVAFLFTSIFKAYSIHCLNVLGPALLHESSQQCHSAIRYVWPQSHSVVHIHQATSATLRKCLDCSWLLQSKYEFVVVVFLFWVLYLWWLMGLFQYIGNFPVYLTILLHVTSLIKDEFYNLKEKKKSQTKTEFRTKLTW